MHALLLSIASRASRKDFFVQKENTLLFATIWRCTMFPCCKGLGEKKWVLCGLTIKKQRDGNKLMDAN